MFWKIIGLLAASLTSFAFIPQVHKMYKTKSAQDVSLATLWQLSCGVALWMFYGISLRDAIIVTANTITLLTLIVAIILYYKYI